MMRFAPSEGARKDNGHHGFKTPYGFAVNSSDGTIWTTDVRYNPSVDGYDTYLTKRSARGDELLVAPPVNGDLTDLAMDPRDGSMYVTRSTRRGGVYHVSALGERLAALEQGDWDGDVVVDTEDFGIWNSHMPMLGCQEDCLWAPMVMRKLDANLQTVLEVSYPEPTLARIVGAIPGPGDISIDIAPPDKYNRVDLRNVTFRSRVAVALLSSARFDALQVDPETLRFGIDGATVTWSWTRDVNHDGLADLVVQFKTADTGIECGDTQASLTGQAYAGLDVRSTDWLRTRCSWAP